jgi:hypothetical protein
VRHAIIDEALADAAAGGGGLGRRAGVSYSPEFGQ